MLSAVKLRPDLRGLILTAVMAVALVVAASMPLAAQDASRAPLIMEGKKTLFQRVLVRDGGPRYGGPGAKGTGKVEPLQALWVYARKGDWIEVGPNDKGTALFWLPKASVVDWKQNIVATFEGSSTLGRLLFFKDYDAAYDVVESENPAAAADKLRSQALKAEAGGPPSTDVVALGPRKTVDLKTNLYVMPILSSQQAVFDSGAFVNLLEVAVARAMPRKHVQVIAGAGAGPATNEALRKNYRAGVVFVVDTTISMQPYINATRDALLGVMKTVKSSDQADAVSFGLIGFRDNLKAAPGLKYLSKTFVDLKEGFSAEKFAAGIDKMTEAQSTSRNFREDSFAGVDHALTSLDWSPFGARYIVLVTDAGPRGANDKLSSTGLSAAGLNSLVHERLGGAAIAVMHLLTPAGKADHAEAAAAYKALSREPNQAPLYFPILNGDPASYRDSAQQLAHVIERQVVAFRDGAPGSGPDPDKTATAKAAEDSPLAAVGRTMQLAYLGAKEGTKAPDVFKAVVADRDFDRTGLKPLSIRLLITKAQLSDLQQALSLIVEKAEENVIDPDKFFTQVLAAAADMSRTPDKVALRGGTSLADAASIGEYLKGLPYKSRIMSITQDDWVRMSISEQQSVVNELYDKIARYRRYNETTDAWVDYLGTGAKADELVYPIPLDDLP